MKRLYRDKEKNFNTYCQFKKKLYFCSPKKGLLAEWLGAGLQNHLLQFESGRDLSGKAVN